MNTLNIFGVPYSIEQASEEELDGADGRCNFWRKAILVSDCSDLGEPQRTAYRKQILRHEILHACLYESGLAYNSNQAETWAMNEEMVDWLAIQGPKILEIWKEANCL